MRRGLVFIVSAPSGTGKTTLVERLVRALPGVVMSRSYTSRRPRPGEVDGEDYNFIDDDRFSSMVEQGAFLEWASIFGHRYGTSAADTERHREAGRDVVLVIDVQGARQVRERGLETIGVFVLPPSFAALEDRLRHRSGAHASEEDLRRRLEMARSEVEASRHYDYVIVNDDVDRCAGELQSIVVAERLKQAAASGAAAEIVETFRTDAAES